MKERLGIANDSIPGVHPSGRMTMVAAAAIQTGQLVKLTAGKITPCAANDVAFGVAEDAAAAGDISVVAVFGATTGSVLMRAGATIAQGAFVATGAAGAAITKATGAMQTAGMAMEAGVAGELFEAAPMGTPV